MAGADVIIGVDLNDDKAEIAKKFGMTHFVKPSKVPGGQSVTDAIVEMTKTEKDAFGGVDYSFDATGNVQVMRDALECSYRGWGVLVGHHWRGTSRRRDRDSPVPAGHWERLEMYGLWRRQGPDRCAQVRGLVHGRQD